MVDQKEFLDSLEKALAEKQAWYNEEKLVQLLDTYRLLFTCVKNLNSILIKRSLITQDPYKYDKRISEVACVSTESFNEQESHIVLGDRLSEYEMMLDFICTYFRFSVENLTVPTLKKLNELNNAFTWENISLNSTNCNTRFLAEMLNTAKINAPAVTISLISDSTEKCGQCASAISSSIAELMDFQKELYKGRLRKDIFEHPEFDKEKAYSSPENELAEIKKVFSKIMGKKVLNTDYAQEIVDEDQSKNSEVLRQKLFTKLAINKTSAKKERKGPSSKEMLVAAAVTLGGLGIILQNIDNKVSDNFEMLFYEKKTVFKKIAKAFRTAFGIKEKERFCTFVIVDKKTEAKSNQKISVTTFLSDLDKRVRVYNGINAKGPEYSKIISASEEAALTFLNKQIQECQQLYVWLEALDEHFKTNVPIENRYKVKGLKIDLSSLRNGIINVNKKRSEYVSYKEELEQMAKLGLSNA